MGKGISVKFVLQCGHPALSHSSGLAVMHECLFSLRRPQL